MSPARAQVSEPARAFECAISSGPEQTRALGARLGRVLRRGDLVAFDGDLGSGKTCMIQGVCAALGVTTRVNSPTFMLINEYAGHCTDGGELMVRHFDLYRLHGAEELEDIGAVEFFHDPTAVCLVEWAGRIPELLPATRWQIDLTYRAEANSRQVTCRWLSPSAPAATIQRGSDG